ncbi:hypothetical protein [Teredinibacter sp. KSP-S5-2]|uniref:hypothetical protein n=1 Tax=Teredinibacter sp. KSP-S5-2 TaxID=3034506 RepID=UPI002934701A|nr:hypothetical protein [Teredinibacter sp. KSP-S5-2]WNO07803.1 hypothetical protein P5V12_12465 [Teredinibacter sp. KSP-S5-2]
MEYAFWSERLEKMHEQSFNYWKMIMGIPLLTLGWSYANQEPFSNIEVCVYSLLIGGFLYFLTQGIQKFYLVFRGIHEELKLALADKYGPYSDGIKSFSVLGDAQLWSVAVIIWALCTLLILSNKV